MKSIESARKRHKPHRRWAATAGGTRLSKVKSLLVGDHHAIEALPADQPRRHPTLPFLRFLQDEGAQS